MMIRIIFLALMALFPLSLHAEDGALSAAEKKEWVHKIETYLNEMDSFKARFLQADAWGAVVYGDILLDRPGHLRLNYDPPVPFYVVADGIWLIHYDQELKQASYLPIKASPASILLEEKFHFGDPIEVVDVTHSPGIIRVTLRHKDEPELGDVTLTFNEAPLELKQWVVTDAQGLETKIALLEFEKNVAIDKKQFDFVDPNFFDKKRKF